MEKMSELDTAIAILIVQHAMTDTISLFEEMCGSGGALCALFNSLDEAALDEIDPGDGGGINKQAILEFIQRRVKTTGGLALFWDSFLNSPPPR
jgi:hypothetical protein